MWCVGKNLSSPPSCTATPLLPPPDSSVGLSLRLEVISSQTHLPHKDPQQPSLRHAPLCSRLCSDMSSEPQRERDKQRERERVIFVYRTVGECVCLCDYFTLALTVISEKEYLEFYQQSFSMFVLVIQKSILVSHT